MLSWMQRLRSQLRIDFIETHSKHVIAGSILGRWCTALPFQFSHCCWLFKVRKLLCAGIPYFVLSCWFCFVIISLSADLLCWNDLDVCVRFQAQNGKMCSLCLRRSWLSFSRNLTGYNEHVLHVLHTMGMRMKEKDSSLQTCYILNQIITLIGARNSSSCSRTYP